MEEKIATTFDLSTAQHLMHSLKNKVQHEVNQNGYIVLKQFIPRELTKKIKEYVKSEFNIQNDVRISGHYKRDQANFHRLDCGEYGNTRFARYFFFFHWNSLPDIIKKIDTLLIFTRNTLADTHFGTDKDLHSLRFSKTCILQYPIGGGFMSKHFERPIKEDKDTAYVVYLALTTRGIDFQSGGAYIENPDGKLIDIEAIVEEGDFVVYRGDYNHGVLGVDKDKHIILDALCGRMNMMSTFDYFHDD